MATHLPPLAAGQLGHAAVMHKPLWVAGLLAGSLHAALVGAALHVGGPSREHPARPAVMQVRALMAMPATDFLALHRPALPPDTTRQQSSLIAGGGAEPVTPTRNHALAMRAFDSQPADPPAPLSAATDSDPRESAWEENLNAAGLRAFIAAEHLDWQPMPFSAPDTRLLDNISASGLALKARLLINAQGVVEDLLPLQPVLAQDERWFAQLRAMFLQTQFTPGRRDGQAVAARLDLDISTEMGAGIEEPPPARAAR